MGLFEGSGSVYAWLGVLILCVIIEALTANLVSVWFAVGALGAIIASLFGAELWVCLIVFIAVSAISLFFTRPIIKKKLLPHVESTNSDSVIGSVAIVEEEIDNVKGSGYVSVAGTSWMARTDDDSVIPVGVQVKIIRIEGVKVICHIESEK